VTDEQVPVVVTVVEIIDGVEVPIGEPLKRTTSRGALDLLHGGYPHEAELQRIADETGEPIEIVRDLADAMAACGTEDDDEARVERQQRAREAGWDHLAPPPLTVNGPGSVADAFDIAIETATRVRVTPEIAEAACEAAGLGAGNAKRLTPVIEAAFRAAGFEVEQ
jgi:hypothetical protein